MALHFVSSSISNSVITGVLVGVLVAGILAGVRVLWNLTRVPSVLSRRVSRRNYLGAVRAESKRAGVQRLDVYAPRLLPTSGAKHIASIQSAWEQINQRGKVRVLTLDLEDCLHAGAELLDKGIEVRVLPNERCLGSDGLTFHLFETSVPDDALVIINHHRGGADRPIRFKGVAPIEVLRARFRSEWGKARSLESVIAERIRPRSVGHQGGPAVWRSIEQAEVTGLHLANRSREIILPHLAFRDSCSYIFLVGLPGSGKSYVKSRLAEELGRLRIDCQSLSDYPYAYLDFLRSLLKLGTAAGNGFRAHDQGAFAVHNERALAPALRALHSDVRDSSQAREVAIIEFARSDLVSALREYDDIRSQSQLIYVNAPADLRHARLAKRAVPPEIRVKDEVITINLSDNHLLPTCAEHDLYGSDNLDLIKVSAHWRDRFFEIDNEVDGSVHVDKKIAEFVDKIISPYKRP